MDPNTDMTPTGPTHTAPMNTEFISRFLVVAITLLFMIMIVILGLHEIPKDNKELFNYSLVAVAGLLAIIVNYQYGASAGEKIKDATISKLNGGPK